MRKNILGSMILLPFIPFVLVLGIGYSYFRSSLESGAMASVERIVDDHRQMIDSFLKERKADLDFVLHAYAFEDLSRSETLNFVFNRLQKDSNAFVDLGVFDENGLHVAYCGPYELKGKDYRQVDWFVEVIKTGSYTSDVFLGYRQVPHFIIAMARQENGRTWVLRATIDTQTFNQMVRKVRIGKTGESYLLNSEGIFQTERRSGGALMERDPEVDRYPPYKEKTQTFIKTDVNGEPYLYAVNWLENKRWRLVVRQERADAFSSLRSAATAIILISVIGGAGIVVFAFYLTDRLVRRIRETDEQKDQLGYQLIRASRLAELGEMAAGFAHEINNPLQIIKSEQTLAMMILKDLKDKGEIEQSADLEEMEESMEQITIQLSRCSKITQAILKFGRKTEPKPQPVDIGQFLEEVTAMIANRAGVHGIRLIKHISEKTPKIQGDPSQLQQVMLNLLNNAIDAIVERHGAQGGELTIATGFNGQKNVQISIIDNGCGIEPENLKKIFSPFFTTKPVGKGTGLGLSVCYGIINGMGGQMEVNSVLGQGTTFTVHLTTGT